jgi:CMP-N,N'-diacetyllegionaminic acid synthase
MSNPSIVALVPARSGSKRVVGKNVRTLAGHPLIAYTLAAALDSGIFKSVVVSTDSDQYAEIATYYGGEVPFLRPVELSHDTSPDIAWVTHALSQLAEQGRMCDCFSILRPTSPFRRPETIRRAWSSFRQAGNVHSLRAVERCKQHPGKMWIVRGQRMLPLLPLTPEMQPWHSSQYQMLPEVFVQNASLEIAWSNVVSEQRTIAGSVIMPFFTEGNEGLDVNDEYDWIHAEHLIRMGRATLPIIQAEPWLAQVRQQS